MKKITIVCLLLGGFLVGAGVGVTAGKAKVGVSPAAWEGVSPEEANANLMKVAATLAGGGSWENIHMGRVYYLAGKKEEAEAIFDRYRTGTKLDAGDLIRIGRVYAQAGDWDQAKGLFDKVLELDPKDADWLIEIGAFYNLNGDRDRAEELFKRGFSSNPKNLKSTLSAAGSYVGVPPRKR